MAIHSLDAELQDQIINSYTYFFLNESNYVWYRFKNDFIYNEAKIEGSGLPREKVSEIIADLRLNRQDSSYCDEKHKDIVETAGQSSMYDYIISNSDSLDVFSIKKLHKLLYQFAPCPDFSGIFRNSNNVVTSSTFETSDYRLIYADLLAIEEDLEYILKKIQSMKMSDFIDLVVRIHHRITQIHPFDDGNGRVSRTFLNWLFRIKGLPPVYLKYSRKDEYYNALNEADTDNSFVELKCVFYSELINTMIQLNSLYATLDDQN